MTMTMTCLRLASLLVLLTVIPVQGTTYYMDDYTSQCSSSSYRYVYSYSHTVKSWYPGNSNFNGYYCSLVFYASSTEKLSISFTSFWATSSIALRIYDGTSTSAYKLLDLVTSDSTPSSRIYSTGRALYVYLYKTYYSSSSYSFQLSVSTYTGSSTTLGALSLPISMDDSSQCTSSVKYVNSGQYLYVNAWAPSNTYYSTISSCYMYFRAKDSSQRLGVSFSSGSVSITSSSVSLSFYDGSSTSNTRINRYTRSSTAPSDFYTSGSYLTLYLYSGYSSSYRFSFQVFALSSSSVPSTITTTAASYTASTYRYMDDSNDDCSTTIYLTNGETETVKGYPGSSMASSSSNYCYLYYKTSDTEGTIEVKVTDMRLQGSSAYLRFYDRSWSSTSYQLKGYDYNDDVYSADTFSTSQRSLTVKLYRGSSYSSLDQQFTFTVTGRGGLSVGAIVGIVCGVIGAVLLMVVIAKACHASSKRSSGNTRIRPRQDVRPTFSTQTNTYATTINYTSTSGQMTMGIQPNNQTQSSGFTTQDPAYPPPSSQFGPAPSLYDAPPPAPSQFAAPPPSYMDVTGGGNTYAPPPPPPTYQSENYGGFTYGGFS